MTPTTSGFREAIAPLWRGNMALAQLLGLCPLLAVTTTVVNGVASSTSASGDTMRKTQTGQLQLYGLFIGLGVAVIAIFVLIFG